MVDQKTYILSLQAQLKGHQVVLTGIKQVEGEIQKFKKTVSLSSQDSQNFADIIEKAGKRALIVAPMWMLLRGAMMGALNTINKIVEDNMKFEASMAEVRGNLEGTASEIDVQMIAIKRTILDTAVNSRRSLNDLTDAFRFLKSANLDFEQSMAGFGVTASLMNAFGLSAEEAARAVAGMYNTAHTKFGDLTTDTEKFAKIGDILAYTYVKQDVLVGELIQSYANFAPYIQSTNDDFLTILTTLGFLNTQMLRAGRTGTVTARAIVEIMSSADKLASIFGVTFDPDKPVNFINVLEQIRGKLGNNTEITQAQGKALQETFGIRAMVAVNLLLSNFDKLKDAIMDARDNSDGFLKRLEQIRMGTVEAQLGRMSNLLSVMGNDFISGVYQVGDFAQALSLLNDTFAALRPAIAGMGDAIGKFGQAMGESMAAWSFVVEGRMDIVMKQGRLLRAILAPLANMIPAGSNLLNMIPNFGETPQQDPKEKAKQEAEVRQKVAEAEKEYQKIRSNTLKMEKEGISRNSSLLKIMGANELDIAQYKVKSLEIMKQYLDEETYVLEKQKAENDLLEAQVKYRQQIVSTYQKASVDLAKAMGATESQILTIQMKILEANKAQIGDAQFLAQMEQLKLQRIVAVEAERQRELQTQANLYLQYQKADETERARLKRMMELRQLTPDELAKRYQENAYDARIIEQYWSNFSSEGQKAIGEVIQKLYNLPEAPVSVAMPDKIPSLFEKVFSPNTVGLFWDSWTQRQTQALDQFGERWAWFSNNFQGVETYANKMTQQAIQQNIDLGTRIDKIEINLPADALETVADEVGKKVTQELASNEELGKKIAKLIRPYV